MTLIGDMSEPERRSWANLIVDITVFYFFIKAMVGKTGIENIPSSGLVKIFIWLIVATIILHVIIAAIFAIRLKSRGYESDERDVEIERKGARNGFWVLAIALNIIIFMFLMQNTFPADYMPALGVSLLTPSHMFFALMATLFLGDIVYRATMVFNYQKTVQ